MKLKKTLSLLLALSLIFAMVAACASDTPDVDAPVTDAPAADAPAADAPAADEPREVPEGVDVSTVEGWAEHIRSLYGGRELNLLVGVHPSTDAMIEFMHEFEEMTGITINLRMVTDGTVQNAAMLEMAGNTQSFDLFSINATPLLEMGGQGLVHDLQPLLDDPILTPPWFDDADIIPAFVNVIATAGGVRVGVPIAGESRVLGFRTDLFEEHGLQPPRTTDELLEIAQFFYETDDPSLFGISTRALSGPQAGWGYQPLGFAFTDSPIMDNHTGEPTFDQPATIQAIQYFADLMQFAPPDVSTFSHEEALHAFMQGTTAMWLDASALIGRIMDPEWSVIYDRVDYVPMPRGPHGYGGGIMGWSFAIPLMNPEPELAWAFIVYMASREVSMQYHQHGGVPSRISILTNPALQAENPTFGPQYDSLAQTNRMMEERNLSVLPDFWWQNEFVGIAGTYISYVLIGQMTAEEAARLGQAEMMEFMEDNVR